ncbi:Uncharacterised protein [Bordetella ansorpii]|uniref:Secreted protein n=2 Tax=Bordetella ansorpii TaxID=288768 RepID=A0A157S612_9BORD|nr:Uncharacterised protein [Bordetella ansorpii]
MAMKKGLHSFLPVAAALAAVSGAAQAGVCDAPFMRDGGQVQLTGKGNIALGADLAFAEVARQSGNQCRARITGTASFGYAGLPPGKSKLDYLMTVRNGQATFVRYDKAGGQPQEEGQFDLRMLGLFAYASVTGEGQRLPGANYRLNIGRDAPVGGRPSTTVRIGEKRVGKRQNLDTPVGRYSCWPITYTRDTDPTMATFKGLTLPIPGLNTTVTDWFCPKVDMVMRQDIEQPGNVKSTVEITQMK